MEGYSFRPPQEPKISKKSELTPVYCIVLRKGSNLTGQRTPPPPPPPPGISCSQHCLLSKKGGEHCLIINLKWLNRFIPRVHFKMEGIPSLKDIILLGDYMIKLDLKDTYFGIPIHPSHQRYLSFIWKDQTFQFTWRFRTFSWLWRILSGGGLLALILQCTEKV